MLVGNSGALRYPFPRRLQQPEGDAGGEFAFLARRFTPRSVFMEVGAARSGELSELALRAASYVERVYAIDVSGRFLQSVLVPLNLRLVLCGGVRLPVPAASVDVAFSGGFIDQLHADDAAEHLASVRRALAPGGEYVCRSINPFILRKSFLEAGFVRVACYAGTLRLPWALAAFIPQHLLRIAAIR